MIYNITLPPPRAGRRRRTGGPCSPRTGGLKLSDVPKQTERQEMIIHRQIRLVMLPVITSVELTGKLDTSVECISISIVLAPSEPTSATAPWP